VLTLHNVADAHDIDIQQALRVTSGRVVRATTVQHCVVDRAARWVVAPQVNATAVIAGTTTRMKTMTGKDDDIGGRRR
jgi:hypothetical protein